MASAIGSGKVLGHGIQRQPPISLKAKRRDHQLVPLDKGRVQRRFPGQKQL